MQNSFIRFNSTAPSQCSIWTARNKITPPKGISEQVKKKSNLCQGDRIGC